MQVASHNYTSSPSYTSSTTLDMEQLTSRSSHNTNNDNEKRHHLIDQVSKSHTSKNDQRDLTTKSRKDEDIPPSHPKFDRSKLSDKEYIGQLLFENKELRYLIESQERTITHLQQQLKVHTQFSNTSTTNEATPKTRNGNHLNSNLNMSNNLKQQQQQQQQQQRDNFELSLSLSASLSPILSPVLDAPIDSTSIAALVPTPLHKSGSPARRSRSASLANKMQSLGEDENKKSVSTTPIQHHQTMSDKDEEPAVKSPYEIPTRSVLRSRDVPGQEKDHNRGKEKEKEKEKENDKQPLLSSAQSASYSTLPNSTSSNSNLSSNVSSHLSSGRGEREKLDTESTYYAYGNAYNDEHDQDDTLDTTRQLNASDGNIIHSGNVTIDSSTRTDDAYEKNNQPVRGLDVAKLRSHASSAASEKIYKENKHLARSTSSIGSTYKSSRIKPPASASKTSTMNSNNNNYNPNNNNSIINSPGNINSPVELAPPTSLKLALGDRTGSRTDTSPSAGPVPSSVSASAYNSPLPPLPTSQSQNSVGIGYLDSSKDASTTLDTLSDTKLDTFQSPSSKFDDPNGQLPSPGIGYDKFDNQATNNTQTLNNTNNLSIQGLGLAPPYNIQLQTINYTTPHQTPPINDVKSSVSASFTSPRTPAFSFNVLNTPKTDLDESSLFIKPDEFQTIFIKVVSTIHINAATNQALKKADDPNLTITINDRETNKEMWRIRKTHSQLCAFDAEIRPIVEYFGLASLPDKASFMSTTPSKIETRRSILQNYFNSIFLMPHIPHIILYKICLFLSLDFVNPLDDYKSGSRKEGYLVRRYKGLGNSWKVRWCQIEGNALEIYLFPGGPLQEQIPLRNAQIGRQATDSVADDKGYRHAFLIMESTKASKLHTTTNKHFFCAETDEERDDWVTALIEFTEPLTDSPDASPQNFNTYQDAMTPSDSGKYLYDSYGNSINSGNNNSNNNNNNSNAMQEAPSSSSGSYLSIDQSSTQTSTLIEEQAKKMKKRSYFSFRNRTSSIPEEHNQQQPPLPPPPQPSQSIHLNQQQLQLQPVVYQQPLLSQPPSASYIHSPLKNFQLQTQSQPQTPNHDTSNSMRQYLDNMQLGEDLTRAVFGRDVEVAYELSNLEYMGKLIPSICFRCLDYLNKTGAVFEEGIFRLSGSASAIRQLKEAFNREYDLDLFKSPLKPDIHTVSGLFKLYLRELPNPILGSQTYDKLNTIIMNNANKIPPSQIAMLFRDYLNDPLQMDKIHYDLCYVIFKFLRQVISQNQINRMNLRNLCIVFVPTLNLSLEVLSTILIDFECIFENGKPILDSNREVLDLQIPNF
ncbi:hypothetical protein LELG_04391 [Lodderomyces elongisporus NRRL YB-4239]|uniref:GTPase-activating protein BEM3 n=1 Tax=Lodderomyces elongisporus (strain ATCC 11503 / CBS 2605 / JCM 1781 / NBRC 1676 / NRRL YB-4239) TaxID=379508 RepID=A5E452_LODEL|nr:hypothetical protein LELG_04391 [Lodderomyces elongisporus NRRL YB-4239]